MGRLQNLFMMVLTGAVASELMWIIRIRNEREKLVLHADSQLKLMDILAEKLKRGEKLDLDKELMTNKEPVSVAEMLAEIEKMDETWKNAAPSIEPSKPKTEEPKTEEPKKTEVTSKFL